MFKEKLTQASSKVTYRIRTKACICFKLGKHLEGVEKSQQSRKCCKINLHPIRMKVFNLGRYWEARHDCLHRRFGSQQTWKEAVKPTCFCFGRVRLEEVARWATFYPIYKSLCEPQNESRWEVNRRHLLSCIGGQEVAPPAKLYWRRTGSGGNTYVLGKAALNFRVWLSAVTSQFTVGVRVSN